MLTVNTCLRLIIILALVVMGTAIVRNVTAAFEEAVSGSAPMTTANR